jgi:hypothetical protein
MVANLKMGGVIALLEEISVLIRMAGHNRDIDDKAGPQCADHRAEEVHASTIEAIGLIVKLSSDLQVLVKSKHVEFAVRRLEAWAKEEPCRWSDLSTRGCALREALRIELKEHKFFAYSKTKGQKFSEWADDWRKIIAAFPEADLREESFAAMDCYALEHPTASVFHSMRVAEIGLRALAKERRVKLAKNKPIDWGTWQEIIKALDDEIKRIGQTWKAGSKKDAALDFYSGARADLNAFKDEYRNLVMHVRKQYDEFQALRALTRVHDFMGRMAERRVKRGRS